MTCSGDAVAPARPAAAPRTVAFITQWFPPEPVTVPVWLVRALRRAGLEVRVLTGVPNYPDGLRHDGYPRFRSRSETLDEFPVRRTPLLASHSRRAIPRLLNYATWALSATAFGSPAFRGADAALVYSSPATAALPAMWQRRRRGIPYVLLVQDVWPDSIFASGFLDRSAVRRLGEPVLRRLVDRTYRQAHAVAVIAPSMKDLLVARGVPESKVHVVYNWVDEEVIRPLPPDGGLRSQLGLDPGELLVMYAGNHGQAQGLDTLLDAMRLLGPASRVRLAMVGEGIDKPRLQAWAADLPHVHFLPARPVEEMPALMADSDVQVISLRDEPLFHLTLPGKVQAVMAAARPVLAVAPGDAAAVVMAAGAGETAPPGDADRTAQALLRLRDLPREQREALGDRARDHYLAHMSEKVGSRRLIELLSAAARSAQ